MFSTNSQSLLQVQLRNYAKNQSLVRASDEFVAA
jgi:hypothetical protein